MVNNDNNKNATPIQGMEQYYSNNSDNTPSDEDKLKRKEKRLKDSEIKRAVKEALTEMQQPSKLSDTQRVTGVERGLAAAGVQLDDLATESIEISRRMIRIGRTVNTFNDQLGNIRDRIKELERKTKLAEDATEAAIRKSERHEDIDRDTNLRLLPIIVAIIAVILATLSYIYK